MKSRNTAKARQNFQLKILFLMSFHLKHKYHLSIEFITGIWGIRVQLRKAIVIELRATVLLIGGRVAEKVINPKFLSSLKLPFRNGLIKEIVHQKVELCLRVFQEHFNEGTWKKLGPAPCSQKNHFIQTLHFICIQRGVFINPKALLTHLS